MDCLQEHPQDVAVPVPYVSRLSQKLQPGQTLVVHGIIDKEAKRFAFSQTSDFILQVFMRKQWNMLFALKNSFPIIFFSMRGAVIALGIASRWQAIEWFT